MNKFLPLMACILALSACAGMRTWDGTLNSLRGKPINDAVIVYGQPDGQYNKNGMTTYVWQDRMTESVFGPTVTAGHGYRLGSPLGSSEFIWSGIETHRCVIRAETSSGIITGITSEGEPGDCETIHHFRREPLGRNYSGASNGGRL